MVAPEEEVGGTTDFLDPEEEAKSWLTHDPKTGRIVFVGPEFEAHKRLVAEEDSRRESIGKAPLQFGEALEFLERPEVAKQLTKKG